LELQGHQSLHFAFEAGAEVAPPAFHAEFSQKRTVSPSTRITSATS
jgi:hypothetical protein